MIYVITKTDAEGLPVPQTSEGFFTEKQKSFMEEQIVAHNADVRRQHRLGGGPHFDFTELKPQEELYSDDPDTLARL